MDATVAARGSGYVCVAATHTVMVAQEDPELRDAVLGADLVVPDGQPLVWALHALGRPLPTASTAPSSCCATASARRSTGTADVPLRRAQPGRARPARANLRRRFPGLKVVGGYSPPFRDLDDAEQDAIADEINRTGADVVWVGIGVPKQEKWMAAMRGAARCAGPRGRRRRVRLPRRARAAGAAAGCSRSGLEWAFRLAQEPRRLWRRYPRYNPRFVAGFARSSARQPSCRQPRRLASRTCPSTSPSSASGGSACRWRSRSPIAG